MTKGEDNFDIKADSCIEWCTYVVNLFIMDSIGAA